MIADLLITRFLREIKKRDFKGERLLCRETSA